MTSHHKSRADKTAADTKKLPVLPPTPVNRAVYEKRALVLKAMAHPSRLMMLDALSTGEKCVADLTAVVGSDPSTVSKHLAVMRAAGIVVDEKRGLQVFYRLRVPCIMQFFGCVEAVMRANEAGWRSG